MDGQTALCQKYTSHWPGSLHPRCSCLSHDGDKLYEYQKLLALLEEFLGGLGCVWPCLCPCVQLSYRLRHEQTIRSRGCGHAVLPTLRKTKLVGGQVQHSQQNHKLQLCFLYLRLFLLWPVWSSQPLLKGQAQPSTTGKSPTSMLSVPKAHRDLA